MTENEETNAADAPKHGQQPNLANTGGMHLYVPTTLADIRLLVSQHVEESTHLDFKRQLPDSGKNDDIAKALSAFANSDGGVLVYGIDEDGQGRAETLCPVTLLGAPERIDLVARQSLDGPVAIESLSIPSSSDSALGFLVVKVPRSTRAPHFHRGTAWGRSSRVVAPLTRHQIGDLFARQPGFAEEFHLLSTHPGRIRVEKIKETAPGMNTYSYYLLFENDGDADVFDVTWEMDEPDDCIHVFDAGLFPVPVMHPRSELRVHLSHAHGSEPSFRVHAHWRDSNDQKQESFWTIVI